MSVLVECTVGGEESRFLEPRKFYSRSKIFIWTSSRPNLNWSTTEVHVDHHPPRVVLEAPLCLTPDGPTRRDGSRRCVWCQRVWVQVSPFQP